MSQQHPLLTQLSYLFITKAPPTTLSPFIPRLRILSFICHAMCIVIVIQSITLWWLENVFWHVVNAIGHLLWFFICQRQLKRQCDTTHCISIGFLSYICCASALWQYNLSFYIYIVFGLFVYFALAKPFSHTRFSLACASFVMAYLICAYYLPAAPDYLNWVVLVNHCVFLFSFILCTTYIRYQLLSAWSQLDKHALCWQQLVTRFFPTSFQPNFKNSRELFKVSNAVVLCCDISDSTTLFSTTDETKAIDILHDIFEQFDRITDHHRWYRVKTNGDQYICICCDTKKAPIDSVWQAVNLSRQYHQSLSRIPHDLGLKIGVSMGPIYQSMTNSVFPKYDIWGITVIRANRLESIAKKNTLVVDEACAAVLTKHIKASINDKHAPNKAIYKWTYQRRILKGLGIENTLQIAL